MCLKPSLFCQFVYACPSGQFNVLIRHSSSSSPSPPSHLSCHLRHCPTKYSISKNPIRAGDEKKQKDIPHQQDDMQLDNWNCWNCWETGMSWSQAASPAIPAIPAIPANLAP